MIRKLFFVLLSLVFVQASVLLQAGEIDPKQGIADPDGKTIWYEGKLLKVEGKGWNDTELLYDRLPAKAKGVAPEHVWNLSHHSAGICLEFITNAAAIQVRWTLISESLAMPHMPATGVSGVDLYSRVKSGKWFFVANGQPQHVTNTVTFNIPSGADNLLYLPLYNGVKSIEIGIPKEKTISILNPSIRDQKKPIVFYGTSITQGGCASRPGLAATAIVSRELDVPVINLGFSGSGKMEPAMADLLSELDPSVYVLDCIWNMEAEMVSLRVAPFVKTLRKTHPDTPILLAEDSNYRNISPTAKGKILHAIYEQLVKDGDKHLYFLSNEGMLGADAEGTVDGCHPNDIGMIRQAAVFEKAVGEILYKQ